MKLHKVTSYAVVITFLVFLSIFSFYKFERAVNGTVSENSANFLKETASLYAGTFKIKLNDQLFMLESQARYFQDVDMNDYNTIKRTITSTKGVGEFKRISVANLSGMTINYDGKSSGNILMKDYFKKAITGVPQISSKISVDEDGEKVLTLAVPIFQNEKVVGVITGTFAYSILDNIFTVDTFDGQGYSMVCDKDGMILIGTKSKDRLCFIDNWFLFFSENKAISPAKLDKIRSDIQSNFTGIFDFTISSESRIVVYTPIGMNDWYVISSVTADFILSQQNRITTITMMLIGVMLFVFFVIFIIITRLVIQKNQVEKDNSRYAISSKTMQTVIFEYDFEHQVLEFTGNTDFVFGENVKRLDYSDFGKITERIHETERGLIENLASSISSGRSNLSTEFRIRKAYSSEFIWYRLSGTVIYDKDRASPIKFIGNIVNVNAQVVHEQELKVQAETDLLSGLLNKVYMEKNVAHLLSQEGKTIFGALFIIDLDNFKQVNDKLGHSFGDLAICDTAGKLSLVFSEKDFIGRIGGDEFCVFLCIRNGIANPMSIVEEKAATLNQILAAEYSNDEETVGITSSIGIALFPSQETTFKALFKKADMALYHVKNNGKNNYAVYNENMENKGESVYE